MRREDDPQGPLSDEGAGVGTVDKPPGMQFDPVSLLEETLVSTSVDVTLDMPGSRDLNSNVVKSNSISDSLLDATLTNGDHNQWGTEKAHDLQEDDEGRYPDFGSNLDPRREQPSDHIVTRRGFEPTPDVRLRTGVGTEEKESVSRIIVDPLNGKFRDLTFASPDHGVPAMGPYDGGGTSKDMIDGKVSGNEQYWDSVWGEWDPNGTGGQEFQLSPYRHQICTLALGTQNLCLQTGVLLFPVSPKDWGHFCSLVKV